MRVVDVVCLIAVIGGAAYVYNVKHEAEIAQDQRRALERDIAAIAGDVGLLEADLAALEQPVRLEAVLADLPDVFDLEPITSDHYIRLSDIPFRSDLIVDADESEEAADDLVAEEPEVIDAPGLIDLLLQQITATSDPDPSDSVAQTGSIDSIGALLERSDQVGTP